MKLIINGQEVTATEIRITGVTTLPAPAPEPEPEPLPEPEPTPPPAPDQPCGPTPRNVTVAGVIDLANAGSQVKHSLRQETRCWRFGRPSDPNLFGLFSFASVTGGSGITRTAWISRCPGGPPLVDAGREAKASGQENTSLRWSATAKRGYFTLVPGETYYINIRNGTEPDPNGDTTCLKGDCDVYLIVYTN